jgi:hypothetical protein
MTKSGNERRKTPEAEAAMTPVRNVGLKRRSQAHSPMPV